MTQDEIDYIRSHTHLPFADICAHLGRPKSTVYYYLKQFRTPEDMERSKERRRQTLRQKAAQRVKADPPEYHEGRADFYAHCHEPEFVMGVGLYWAEGSKGACVQLPSSDPRIVRVFQMFARRYLPHGDLSVRISHPEEMPSADALAFWTEELLAPWVLTSTRSDRHRTPGGVATVSVRGGSRLSWRMRGMLDAYREWFDPEGAEAARI